MPLLSLLTSAPTPPDRQQLFQRFSALLAKELGKPESYVMVALKTDVPMAFAGDATTPACYAELKNVGQLADARVTALSRLLCAEIAGALGVVQDRIYIEFTNADGALWGWNGETFG